MREWHELGVAAPARGHFAHGKELAERSTAQHTSTKRGREGGSSFPGRVFACPVLGTPGERPGCHRHTQVSAVLPSGSLGTEARAPKGQDPWYILRHHLAVP